MELKRILTKGRVILLIIFLLLSLLAINPRPFNKGVSIQSIGLNSSAYLAGIPTPKPTGTPLSKEIITAIDNEPIKNTDDFYAVVANMTPGVPVQIKTSKGLYQVTPQLNQTNLGLVVVNAPTSNIREGLDLQGGTRMLLEPAEKLSTQDMGSLIASLSERLNVFGLTDVTIQQVSDLEGKTFIEVDVAGGNDQEVKDLIAKQGKFEAKIGNISVFKGGNDITYVCRSADCSGLSPYQAPTQASATEWDSQFRFSISLSNAAAQRMANVTKDLTVTGQYLSEPISLFLDDQPVDQLQISSSLRGQAVTDIAISGPGTGTTEQESELNALDNMKKLQTILITGSLPVKLNIDEVDTVSPILGKTFIHDSIVMMFLAIIAVTLIIYIRYRKAQVVVPIMITGISEVVIILGVAALIGWNIDIPAIAGILVAVGTGVDSQIVIVDESTAHRNKEVNWLKRIKNAFFIILASYFTGLASMFPLLFAGAGLLKGFALTSMLGITIGVFITRPAFAAVVEQLLKDE